MCYEPTANFHGENTKQITDGQHETKSTFRACAKCSDSHHPAHAQSPIRAFGY